MKKKCKVVIVIILILVGLIGGIATIVKITGIYDPDNIVYGNNLNGSGYGKGGIHSEKSESVEKLLEKVLKQEKLDYKDMKMLYQIQTENLEKIFMLYKNEIRGYEFIINGNGTYSYTGSRKLDFANVNMKNRFSWKETVRSDLCSSTGKSYKRYINPRKNYGVLPAWGVSDTDQVKDMTVDGQKVDQVIEFTKDEETYYLWIIDDLQTENNAVDIVIGKKNEKGI